MVNFGDLANNIRNPSVNSYSHIFTIFNLPKDIIFQSVQSNVNILPCIRLVLLTLVSLHRPFPFYYFAINTWERSESTLFIILQVNLVIKTIFISFKDLMSRDPFAFDLQIVLQLQSRQYFSLSFYPKELWLFWINLFYDEARNSEATHPIIINFKCQIVQYVLISHNFLFN